MLSKEVRDALEAEREHLVHKRRQILSDLEAQIKAIDALLGHGDFFGAKQQALALRTMPPAPGDGPLAGKGLREAMKTVLVAYPSGLRPFDLTAKLEQLGYHTNGSLPLKTRVWAEIGRLKKERRIRKRGKGYVWVVKETAPENELHTQESGA
jgi:hypothetical protein